MKITCFNPLIITPNAADAIEVFEALGFEKKHTKTGINDKNIDSVDLKSPDGYRVNIANVETMPRDMVAIRMNVDNFDEAYDMLISMGFINTQGDKVTDTGSSRATLMMSPSGFAISLCQHIKE